MANAVDTPLISHQEDDTADDTQSEISDAEDTVIEWPAGRPGLFIWLLTLSAGISGLLFGCKYDTPEYPTQLLTAEKMTLELFPLHWFR